VKNKKVLIVKIGALGDIVLMLILIQYLREQKSDIQISWVVGRSFSPLLKEFPEIREIITVDEEKLFRGTLWQRFTELLRVMYRLLGKRFSLVIVGYRDWRYRLLSVTARRQVTRYLGNIRHRQVAVEGRWRAAEYLRLLTGLDDYRAPNVSLPVLKRAIPSNILQPLYHANRPLVAIAPGGARNILRDDKLRRWPINNYVELAKRMIDERFNVIITGSISDSWVIQHFLGLNVVNLIGRTSILDLVGLYAGCSVVITHDSGSLHLAQLADARVIALFGPTLPTSVVPENEKIHVIWQGRRLACCPCYDGKNYAKCDRNVCMEMIGVDQVFELALKIVNTGNYPSAL